MTTFTDQQARGQLDAVLNTARQEGEVRIRAQDGQEFSVRPVPPAKSPLDIPGVDLHLTAEEIVQAVREGRERQQTPPA
jgi:hypothetical protein